jgi:hypothetical protein
MFELTLLSNSNCTKTLGHRSERLYELIHHVKVFHPAEMLLLHAQVFVQQFHCLSHPIRPATLDVV